jgi:hypothetical protein
MGMILMHKRYAKSSWLTIYNAPKPRWNHPSFCRILLLHGLVKAHGMVVPIHSLSTGRIRSAFTRTIFPLSDHFSNGQKQIMLKNAVNGIMELGQVKNTADKINYIKLYVNI